MASIAEETEQVMENVRVLLKEAGLGFEHLVKVTIFLSNMDHYAAVNDVYARYFDDVPPAREAVAVKGLPRNVNVEISGIAYPDDRAEPDQALSWDGMERTKPYGYGSQWSEKAQIRPRQYESGRKIPTN